LCWDFSFFRHVVGVTTLGKSPATFGVGNSFDFDLTSRLRTFRDARIAIHNAAANVSVRPSDEGPKFGVSARRMQRPERERRPASLLTA